MAIEAIKVFDGNRNHYGTKRAGYLLRLDESNLEEFAEELLDGVMKANSDYFAENRDSFHFLRLRSAERKSSINTDPYDEKISEEARQIVFDNLTEALNESSNILLTRNSPAYGGRVTLVNFVARFATVEDPLRNRYMDIRGFSLPNDVWNTSPQFLYNLGEKFGEFVEGEDFDVRISNFRHVKA